MTTVPMFGAPAAQEKVIPVVEDMDLLKINGLRQKDVGRLDELGVTQTYILQYLLKNGRTKAAEFVREMLKDGDIDSYEWGENEMDAE